MAFVHGHPRDLGWVKAHRRRPNRAEGGQLPLIVDVGVVEVGDGEARAGVGDGDAASGDGAGDHGAGGDGAGGGDAGPVNGANGTPAR